MSVLATFHTACGCTREQWVPAPPPWQFKVAIQENPLPRWVDETQEVNYPPMYHVRVFERRGNWARATEHIHAHCDYWEVIP